MTEAIQAALDKFHREWNEFKGTNDKLIEQKVKGHVDPLLAEKHGKMEAALNTLQADLQKKMDDLETRINRSDLVVKPVEAESVSKLREQAAVFGEFLSAKQGREIVMDVDHYKAYKKAFAHMLRRSDKSLTSEMQAALNVGSDPDGGYYVTPDVNGRIVELIYETSPIRQLASVQNISSDALEGKRDLDEATSGGWVGEAQARPSTATPQVGEYRIPAHEQYAMPEATQKILDDSAINIEEWLSRKVSRKLTRGENTAFVSGNGILKPKGFLSYAAGTPSKATWEVIQQINSGAAGAFAATDPGDKLIDLVFALKNDYRPNARFLMARTSVAAVRKLQDGQGNYLWAPDFAVKQAGTLLGYPIVEGEDMPVIAANSLSIAFGDFREAYQIVDRLGIRVLRDPFTNKPYVRFYTTKRVGGDVVNFEALKLMKFAV